MKMAILLLPHVSSRERVHPSSQWKDLDAGQQRWKAAAAQLCSLYTLRIPSRERRRQWEVALLISVNAVETVPTGTPEAQLLTGSVFCGVGDESWAPHPLYFLYHYLKRKMSRDLSVYSFSWCVCWYTGGENSPGETSGPWQHSPELSLGKLKQGDHKSEASLGWKVILYLKSKITVTKSKEGREQVEGKKCRGSWKWNPKPRVWHWAVKDPCANSKLLLIHIFPDPLDPDRHSVPGVCVVLLCMLWDASFHTCPFSQSPCAAADAVFGKEVISVWTDVGRIGLPWCWGHHFPATAGKLWPLCWDNLTFPMIFFLSSPTFCPFLRLQRAYLRSGDVDVWSQIVFEQGHSLKAERFPDRCGAGREEVSACGMRAQCASLIASIPKRQTWYSVS